MNEKEFRIYQIRAEHFRDMLRDNYISENRPLEAVKKAEKSYEIVVRMAENNGKNSYVLL